MFSNYASPYYSKNYSKTGAERDRPSTLNLGGTRSSTSGGAGTASQGYGASGGIVGTLGGPASNSGTNMPSKPSRYFGTTAPTAATGGSSLSQSSSNASGAGVSGSGGGRSTSSAYTNIPSSYSSYGNQRAQQHPQQEDVITVPPKSTLSTMKPGLDLQSQSLSRENPMSSSSLSSGQYYKSPGYSRPAYVSPYQIPHTIQLQQPQAASSHVIHRPSVGVSASKSTHNLIMDSIPDVFCLSCPPAEFKFSDAYRAKTLPRTGKENERLIGFATLPEQVHRKSVKKGFDFTLMAIGESGLGKSTLINSLFLADFYQNRKAPTVNDLMKRTTSIQKHTIEIEERGVKLRLTVVDTPGFGDAINSEDSWKTCVDYIDEQFQQYFQAESGLNRRHIQDTRVHCCLYFVPPYGHGLRALDIEALKSLQSRVNVIPVIAKADTLTPSEVKKLKDQILDDLRSHQIQIYQFPECDEEEDEEFKRQDRELKAAIPFAVASSDTFVEVAGKRVRGRQYPWGIVEVENPNHSDFCKLRTMLIQSHMHDLKETTQDLHYENFRAKAIAQISNGTSRERSKLKRDSSYESPQDLLQQKEAEIKRMQQMISNMEAKLKAASHPKSMRDSIIDL